MIVMRFGLTFVFLTLASSLHAHAACDIDALREMASLRAPKASTSGSSEGAHLELACTDLKVTSADPTEVYIVRPLRSTRRPLRKRLRPRRPEKRPTGGIERLVVIA